ncbi:hypothetical protein ABZP36_034132 [Zizania latifolia]
MGDTAPYVIISSDEEDDDTQYCRVLHFDVDAGNGGVWAKLLPRMINKVANDVLQSDVMDYIRLRTVCNPWCDATTDPSSLHPRFFPRNWLLQPESWVEGTYLFCNVLTGASLRIPMPIEADMYTQHGRTEGLLVLHHQLSDELCLLNPLTQASIILSYANMMYCDSSKNTSFMAGDITAACVMLDEETTSSQSQPIIVVSITYQEQSAIFYAKPNDLLWSTVDVSCIEEQQGEMPSFKGGLAVKGCFYVPTRVGNVLKVELRPQPHLAYVAKQTGNHSCIPYGVCSYLIPSIDNDEERVLLARLHTSDNTTGCMLFVLQVASGRFTIVTVRYMIVLLPYTTL